MIYFVLLLFVISISLSVEILVFVHLHFVFVSAILSIVLLYDFVVVVMMVVVVVLLIIVVAIVAFELIPITISVVAVVSTCVAGVFVRPSVELQSISSVVLRLVGRKYLLQLLNDIPHLLLVVGVVYQSQAEDPAQVLKQLDGEVAVLV